MPTYPDIMCMHRLVVIVAAAAIMLLQPACTEASGTGRSQFNILSVDDELDLGQQAYVEELDAAKQAGHTVLTNGAEHDRVMGVSRRIFDAANRMHPEIAQRRGHPVARMIADQQERRRRVRRDDLEGRRLAGSDQAHQNRSMRKGLMSTGGLRPATRSAISVPVVAPSVSPRCEAPKAKKTFL